MRFSAVMNDSAAIDQFATYLTQVNRMCKKNCCVKIQPNGMTFMSSGNMSESGHWFCLFISKDGHLFRSFSFAGLDPSDPEKNYIYFEFALDEMSRMLNKDHHHMKLKLANNSQIGPYLRVELQSPCSDLIVHEFMVRIIPSRSWDLYRQPTIGHLKMSIYMPPSKQILRLLHSLKSMKAKFVKFRSNNEGEMYIESNTDQGQLSAYFSELQNDRIESDSQEDFATVRLMTNSVHQFYSALPPLTRIKLNTITDRMAEFKTFSHEEDAKIVFVVGNITE
ncbi:hypothetical protein WR25_22629 [Diploscapter pachys]|uniref:Checkpoint protein n=1 Tax=Diploscapter pachys TaxID=2018661 RepID=A0A2A2LR39_9BILA|nr:hypothetical protein WR25_22629 [Diploscapter pachys]